MRQNYQPQQNEPNQIAVPVPVNDWDADLDMRFDPARDKVCKPASQLILCISFLSVIFFSAFLYCLYKTYFSVDQMQSPILDSLKSMSENLEADPIMEIQIVDYGSACPDNFETWKLGVWPGTVTGCLCEDGILHYYTCEKVDSPKCKKEIPSTSPIDMYEWEGSGICIKRAVLGTDYMRKIECPQGYKECYPGGCFKGGDCPITKLEITSTGTTNKFKGKDKYLTATKTPGELPLINVQVTLGDIPCFTQDLFSQAIENSSYHLSPGKRECDKYGLNTQFSTKLDSQTAFQSFTQNSFSYFTMNLPYFEKNANSTVSVLSSMVRIKTARHDSCLHIDVTAISRFIPAWNNGAGDFYMGFAFLLFAFQGSILMCSVLLVCKSSERDVYGLKMFFKFNYGFCFFLLIFGSIWNFGAYQSFKIMKEESERFDSLKCFEGGQGSLVISDYLESIRPLDDSSWSQLGIVLCSVSWILLSVWFFVKIKRIQRM